MRDVAGFVGAEVVRRLNLEITGGSTSIRGYHDIVRDAGAVARALLAGSAARAWGVEAERIEAQEGELSFGAHRMTFAEALSGIDPEDARRARPRAEGRGALVGRPLPRLDLPPKVDGSARFGADVRVPGMVFAAVAHGPAGNGRLVEVRGPAGARFVKGENFVAAIGETSFEARRALAALEPRWTTDGPPAGDDMEPQLAAALDRDDPKPVHEEGDVAARLGPQPLVADYRLPFLAHACLEPMVATCRIADGRVELWGPTQSRTIAVGAVARALGVDPEAVVVHPTLVGGGFGRKAEADHFVEAALVARAIGRPVQLLYAREEDFQADRFRPAVAARLRGRVGADGRIAAFELRIAVPSVGRSFMQRNMPALAFGGDGPSAQAIEGAERLPYEVGAFRAVHLPVEVPVPLGYWRSVGHSFSAFLVESFMDELAAAAGADPLAFRLRHLGPTSRHAAVLKALGQEVSWGEAPPRGLARGLAVHESFGSVVAVAVEAGVEQGAIRVSRAWAAIDCGRAINPDAVRAQVEGAIVQGLSAALYERVSFAGGFVRERNFDAYRLLSLAEAPSVAVRVIEGGGTLGGVGEPGLPPVAPALANALARATGKRWRTLPLALAL